MKKHDVVRTKNGFFFFITEVSQESNFGYHGRLIVKLTRNGNTIFDIEKDDSKKPQREQHEQSSGYLTDWGLFDDEEVSSPITNNVLYGASWTKEGSYSYDESPLDVKDILTVQHYDSIVVDSFVEEDKAVYSFLDYDAEFKGWFKEENYSPKDLIKFEDLRWESTLKNFK